MDKTDFYNSTIIEQFLLKCEIYPKKQVKARERLAEGNIFNYMEFPKSTVQYFTDALFGVFPECKNIVDTIQLMNFVLFDGQANVGWYFGPDRKIH